MIKRFQLIVSIAVMLATSLTVHAAQPYFEGKTITFQVGSGAGGRQDRIARTLARYMAKYIPGNPLFVIQNRPGGQGIPAMMTLTDAPKDGSFMSMVVSTYMEGPYFGAPGANYDPRSFVYIGAPSTGKQRNTLVVHRSSGIQSIDDLKKKDFKFGALRVGHRSYLYGRLITDILGLKVRWVVGYSTPELYIAMERGEAHGRVNDAASMFTERREWFDKREVTPLIAMALPDALPPIDHPLFKGVPSIMQFAKTDVHKDIIKKINSTSRLGGSMALPPGTPDSIRKILSDAAQKVGNDLEFQKEWETLVLEGNKFEKMFTAEEVMESVKVYTDWQPEIIKSYKKLAHEAPKQ